ncbi:hypothetical protein PVAND_017471 [Polypedilum vanderplanki]|uniref:DNA/RNA non-specific endonuclease n=1 Tax=Polypedilum vanderplanki TaxID=319348 RepID=A0A9J6BIS9_POLVA|nr:hypothetical protein PVAND_017471 [Polypedilum vanderplanki]
MKAFFIFSIFIVFSLNSSNLIEASKDSSEERDDKSKGCKVDLKTSFSETSPLLIQNEKLYQPKIKDKNLIFSQNEMIEMYCEEWTNFVDNNNEPLKGSVIAICENDNNFLIQSQNTNFPFEELKCKNLPKFTRKQTITNCYNEDNDAVLHEIGYQIDNNRFLSLYESCFNGHRTWYTKYTIDKYWNNFVKFTRPLVFENDIFDMQKNYFSANVQKENLGKIFSGNLPSEIQELYKNGGFFNRGHLAASSDFIFPSNKNLTFHLINVAPQWKNFNEGNWVRIETATANYAARKSRDLTTYTGTYGVINFKAYGVDKDFYLGDSILPVPMLYYRIIINRNKGVVFLGLNDPFPTNTNDIENYKICQDISDKYSWDKSFDAWNMHRQNISRGYSYACELNEFLDIVQISDIKQVSGVLGVIRKDHFRKNSIIIICVAVILTLTAGISLLFCLNRRKKWLNCCSSKPLELKTTNNYDRLVEDHEQHI